MKFDRKTKCVDQENSSVVLFTFLWCKKFLLVMLEALFSIGIFVELSRYISTDHFTSKMHKFNKKTRISFYKNIVKSYSNFGLAALGEQLHIGFLGGKKYSRMIGMYKKVGIVLHWIFICTASGASWVSATSKSPGNEKT